MSESNTPACQPSHTPLARDPFYRRQIVIALEPLLDAVGVAHARAFAGRIEQDHNYRSVRNRRLHDQAAPCFADVTGFGQTDVPLSAAHQTVGVVESGEPDPALLRKG